jgi:hypothetical protein
MIKQSTIPVIATYDSGMASSMHFTNVKTITKDVSVAALKIKVTTPAFFSKFVTYSDSITAFEQEACTDEKKRTIHVSEPKLLQSILESATAGRKSRLRLGFFDKMRWQAVSIIRSIPWARLPTKDKAQLDESGLSELDRFVASLRETAWEYRRNTTRLLIAKKFAFGSEGLVHIFDLLLRGLLIYLAVVVQNENVSPLWVHGWGFLKG